ncbi:diguanylate cyclase [Paramixta manurensis]|uniref:Diguanylate cyclase n=1 Tax=Paramixta manurensis TaxID=2740817 RepID=A0A6M8UDU7_9GAMM|nr:diguanylate cyclase [Erwiniaceae bacterium PD-1]
MVRHNSFVSALPHSLPTLRQSLQRIHLIIILVSLSVSGVSLSVLSLFALRSYAESNLQLVASTVSYAVKGAVLANDQQAAQDILQGLGQHGEFAQGKIYRQQNNPLAAWHSRRFLEQNKAHRFIASWFFPHPVSVAITHHNQEIGRVWLTGNAETIIRYIYLVISWLMGSLLFTALFASILSHRMHQGILRGLQNIASVAHDVRARRIFTQRVPGSDIAELNKLSSDFNGLLDEMAKWQQQMKRQHDSLAFQASHDALTRLPNRLFFERELKRLLSDPSLRRRAAVLFIDGDRFKQVNDTYGHAAGDDVLVETARRLRANLRASDLVARLGGDEFAVLLHNIDRAEQAAQAAHHLILAMREPILLPGGEAHFQTLSIGVALAKNHHSPQALLAQADAAMYSIKARGGGGYLSTSSLQASESA